MKAIFLLLGAVTAASGHDIPNDVTVQAVLRPDGNRLLLTVHAPTAVLRDIDFPERSGGAMDLARVDAYLREGVSVWISDAVEVYEGDRLLPRPRIVRTWLSVLSDKAYLQLDGTANVFWNQTNASAVLEYPIRSDRARFSIHPAFGRLGLRVVTLLRFQPPDGAERALEFTGDPGLVRLDPRWFQAAGEFVRLGFFHILDGTDHLLFLFCLVIPFRRFRALVPVVTAFTAAHSITLIASAYDLAPGALWFPPLIETMIAASIVYMALENIVGAGTVQRRWLIAFGFGLVHGFGFSFALRETLQLAGSHLLASLLSFNAGVELGQLLVLALLIPALDLFFRRAVEERMGTIVLSALVAHTGWHWMTDRWDRFRQYRFELPPLDASSLTLLTRWLLIVVLGGGAVWFIARLWSTRAARVASPDQARPEGRRLFRRETAR